MTISPISPHHPATEATATAAVRSSGERVLRYSIPRTVLLLLLVVTVVLPGTARAGTYVINNCPSAPTANANPGPWTVIGSLQSDKGSCSGGTGDYIAPRSGSMSPNTADGVRVSAPAGNSITIHEAKVWWSVPHQISGAETFAIALANGSGVGGGLTPLERQSTPENLVLPSSTTTLTLEDYCSSSDGPQGCVFGSGANNNLQLFGAQLTLADSDLPTSKVLGGSLADSSTLTGTGTLDYEADEPDSGVRSARLTVDGEPAAKNDYIAQCPYQDFAACPTHISDTMSWNTASVADGKHAVQAIVESAAQNTSIVYDATITTQNAPANSTPPTILTPGQIIPGAALSTHTGNWSAPTGAGPIAYGYQWEDCDAQGNNCVAIASAQNATYTPAPSDVGHTLRVLINASDNDGQTSASSTVTSVVLASQGSLGTAFGPGTRGPTTTGPETASMSPSNGIAASETAQLRLGLAHALSRTFARSHRTPTQRSRTTNHKRHAHHLSAGGWQQYHPHGDACPHTPGWNVHGSCPSGVITNDRDHLSRIPNRNRSRRGTSNDPRVRRGERATTHYSAQHQPQRCDHDQRHRTRTHPQARHHRRSTSALPGTLGAIPNPTNRQPRTLPRHLPIPRRHRSLPIPCHGPLRTSQLPLLRRAKPNSQCHHPLEQPHPRRAGHHTPHDAQQQ